MDYAKIYRDFIADRKSKPKPEGYTERHHILPRSLGGGDEPGNLIDLTAEDHYFAHCCLAKIHGGKMWSALFAIAHMAKTDRAAAYFSKRRMVRAARAKAAVRRSQNMRELWASGQFKRERVYAPKTDAQREHMRQVMLGRKLAPEVLAKVKATRSARARRFEFIRVDGGETFAGTCLEFQRHTGMSQSLASCLTRGKTITAKGWALAGTDPRAAFGRDPAVRQFEHRDGRRFAGTAYEMRTQFGLDCGSVSKLLSGKLGTVGGWRLCNHRGSAPSV